MLSQELPSIEKGIRINYEENDFYKLSTCVEEIIILAQRYSRRFTEFKLGTVAWMEAQPLKDFEKAVIHP
jgi:hypothetical protein